MEAVVHQTVGDVAAVDVVVFLEVGQVENHLVTHAARFTRIVGAVLRLEGRRHVVGVHDRHLGSRFQTFAAQHLDVTVGDREEHGRTPGCRCHGRDAFVAAGGDDRMRGEELAEVLRHADRTYARAAAAVRHCEGLVQVQVADVRTDVAGVREAYLGVHVGAVHIYLSAGVVYGIHDLADAALEYAVRRGVGDHHAGQLRAVLLGFGLQVLHVDIAVGVAVDRDDLHAGHRRRSGVGAVCRRGDQDDVAVALAPALVVGADHHQSRVFACGARIGHQRAGGEAGDGRQVGGQPVDQFAVAFGLVGGSERVHVLEPGERQGLHENLPARCRAARGV